MIFYDHTAAKSTTLLAQVNNYPINPALASLERKFNRLEPTLARLSATYLLNWAEQPD